MKFSPSRTRFGQVAVKVQTMPEDDQHAGKDQHPGQEYLPEIEVKGQEIAQVEHTADHQQDDTRRAVAAAHNKNDAKHHEDYFPAEDVSSYFIVQQIKVICQENQAYQNDTHAEQQSVVTVSLIMRSLIQFVHIISSCNEILIKCNKKCSCTEGLIGERTVITGEWRNGLTEGVVFQTANQALPGCLHLFQEKEPVGVRLL